MPISSLQVCLCLLSLLIFSQTACGPFFVKFGKTESVQSAPATWDGEKKDVFALVLDPTTSENDAISLTVHNLLQAKNFAAIDRIADEARTKKERLTGGYWKLEPIYFGLTQIIADDRGQIVTDQTWESHIETLKEWKEANPGSVTARIALAEAYTGYGWFARGNGYSNTVTRQNNGLFMSRLQQSKDELFEAHLRGMKCPYWYSVSLENYLGANGSAEPYPEVFEEAIRSEPDYPSYYIDRAASLQPKWGGKEGDWQKFVDDLPAKLASVKAKDADIIYFIVATGRQRPENVNFAMLSKEHIKKGFDDMDKKYGSGIYNLNQLALISSLTRDIPVAREAFEKIGTNIDRRVWNQDTFNAAKESLDREQIAAR